MKNNIFGYLFFIFIIIIMAFAIYKVNSNKKEEENNNSNVETSKVSIQKGTDLTLAIAGFDSINPIISKNKNVQDVSKIIFDSLVYVSEDGKAEPCLATEWETTDNLTYIFKLRGGAKWSDGTYFSSSDVQFTIGRIKDTNDCVYAENIKAIEEVDIIDNTTIRIILSYKVPFFEYYLTFPILSSKYYGDDDFNNTKKNDTPISTGRFQISEKTGNSIILTKNSYWWNKENDDSILKRVTINFYSTVAELYNAFKLGGIDLISTTNKDYQNYIGKIGYNIKEIEGRNFVFLGLNTNSQFLSDINVRKAIRSAINCDEIISNIYENSYTKENFPIAMSNFLVNSDSNKSFFNIGEMENYLKDAGWYLRKKQWQKTIDYRTKKLELTLVVRQDSNRVEVADYIKDTLEEKGIIVDVLKVNDSDYTKYIQDKNYDMILAEMINPITPDLTTYFSDGNLANFENEEVNEIFKVINNITNEEELKMKYQKLYEIYNEEVPYIGIGRNKIYVITSTYLNGEINSKWYNLFFKFKDWYKN